MLPVDSVPRSRISHLHCCGSNLGVLHRIFEDSVLSSFRLQRTHGSACEPAKLLGTDDLARSPSGERSLAGLHLAGQWQTHLLKRGWHKAAHCEGSSDGMLARLSIPHSIQACEWERSYPHVIAYHDDLVWVLPREMCTWRIHIHLFEDRYFLGCKAAILEISYPITGIGLASTLVFGYVFYSW